MAVSAKWYGKGVDHVLNGALDWDADTIHVSLHTSTYTPDQDADDFFNDATNEISGGGYPAGGNALASKTRTYDGASNTIKLDAADSSFTFTASKTFRYAVIYKKRGGAASADELLGYVDFGTDQTTDQTYNIVWHADGILKAVVA
jgi:hypothetical protein